MAQRPGVVLSGFADEAAVTKQAVEQLAVMAGLGLSHYSLRFIDLGAGVKNVMKLDDAELGRLIELQRQYDMQVATIGSPIGKVKLRDQADGSTNAYIPFPKYLAEDVQHAIEIAHRLGTRLLRGFSFYPPRGADPWEHLDQAVDQIGQIAERCRRAGIVYGLELEANLVGCDGGTLSEIHRRINNPALVLIFDGGNVAAQNLPERRCLEEFEKMIPGLGWIHVKDYKIDPALVWSGHVDEDRLKNFVPAGEGDGGYRPVLQALVPHLPSLTAKLAALGGPGFILDLEPHLKGGGQFGGYSGPDGMGVALRALCRLLDDLRIDYHLRDLANVKRTAR